MRGRHRRRSGFTLIEIMAVLVIVAVILMAVVPNLDNLVPAYRLRAAAREVAAMVEQGQSWAVTTRKEYKIAYDLDSDTYWLILPPAEREQDDDRPAADDPAAAMGESGAGGELTKEGRPVDDVEHGPPPPDPDAPAEEGAAETDAEREATQPKGFAANVVFASVIVGEDEKSVGHVEIPFTRFGSDGSHIVGLKLDQGEDQTQVWVKFNALTRTVEFYDERPTARTLSGGDAR